MAGIDAVKRFLTIAMGTGNETSGKQRLSLDGFNREVIDRIHVGILRRYPKLELFKGWGTFAQNLEGHILKDVLLEGIKENIIC